MAFVATDRLLFMVVGTPRALRTRCPQLSESTNRIGLDPIRSTGHRHQIFAGRRKTQDPRSVSLNLWTAILSRSKPANVDEGGFKAPTKPGQGQSGTNSAALLLGVQGEEFAKEGTTPCPVLHCGNLVGG